MTHTTEEPIRDPDGTGRSRTPLGWRLAAGLLLGGGAVLGFAAAAGGRAVWVTVIVAIVVVGFVGPVVLAGRRARPRVDRPLPGAGVPSEPGGAGASPVISVFIPARDEARVIGAIVADLAAQDHRGSDGAPRFEVIVIDDRSSDGTGERAAAAAASAGISAATRVVARRGTGLRDGKAAALRSVPLADCAGDVLLVLDADARVGPGFLRALAGHFGAGADAVTARRRIRPPFGSALAAAQDDEQAQDAALQGGRAALGGCAEFRGNGMAIRRELLVSVGGWPVHALTEDLDLASRIAAEAGVLVAWAADAVVWEEAVPTWRGLLRQRLRWAEGAVRRYLELGPAVVASPRLALVARLDFLTYGVQLAAPGLILGAAAATVVVSGLAAAAGLIAVYLAGAGILAYDGLRWAADLEGNAPKGLVRVGRALRGAAFSMVWLAAIPGGFLRVTFGHGPMRWDKTSHHGAGTSAPGA